MSTEVAKLESLNEGRRLYLTQYFGGKKQGLCLQLTPSYGEHYIQLNKKQTQELVKELQNWLGETELNWYTRGRNAYENFCYNIACFPSWFQLTLEQRNAWEEMFP